MTATISVKRGNRAIVCRLYESEHYLSPEGVHMVRMVEPSTEVDRLRGLIGAMLIKEFGDGEQS